METFEFVAKKRRWKTKLMLALLSLVMAFIAMLGAKALSSHFIIKQANEVIRISELLDAVAYPNQRIYAWSANGGDYFHGGIKNKWLREVAGVPVQSTVQEIDFSWTSIDWSGLHLTDDSTYLGQSLYDLENNQKKGQFYNPKAKSVDGEIVATPTQEIPYLKQIPHQMVEVYISFDQPYTAKEIREKVPKNIETSWYWIGTTSRGDSSIWRDMDLYGVEGDWFLGNSGETTVARFLERLQAVETIADKRTYGGISLSDDIASYVKQFSKETARDQLTFGGVVLTGRAEDFAALEKADWIYASSIGTVVPDTPYSILSGE